jgi:hypothetical protein
MASAWSYQQTMQFLLQVPRMTSASVSRLRTDQQNLELPYRECLGGPWNRLAVQMSIDK